MKKEKLYSLRQEFQTMLEEYEGTEKIKLNKDTLELLLFNNESIYGQKYKYFLRFNDLNKLDLSELSFDNVDVCRVDFTDLNVKINPQTVFLKNLSYMKAKSVIFTGSFDGALICNVDFTGSKNALIDPQTISAKNLSFATLKDAQINGNFDNTIIRGASFAGAKGKIIINPQNIMNKDLSYTTLENVVFIGPFDDCIIESANFNKAIGVKINPNKIYNHNLKKCNFSGVIFTDTIKNCLIQDADFSEANNVEIDLSTSKFSKETNMENAKITTNEYDQKLYELKKAFKIKKY